MKIKATILLSCTILIISSIPVLAQHYIQSVLQQHFDIKLDDESLHKLTSETLIKVLKENQAIEVSNVTAKALSEFSVIYGEVTLGLQREPLLWVYKTLNVHHGILVIFNRYGEVIYLDEKVGAFKGAAIKDVFGQGIQYLTITHGLGGTGLYINYCNVYDLQNGLIKKLASYATEGYESFTNILPQYMDEATIEALPADWHKSTLTFKSNLNIKEHKLTVLEGNLSIEGFADISDEQREKLDGIMLKHFGMKLGEPKTFIIREWVFSDKSELEIVRHHQDFPTPIADGLLRSILNE